MSAPSWQWRALDMRRERKTYQEIAAILGVPKSTVKYWCGERDRHNAYNREKRALAALAKPSPYKAAHDPVVVVEKWTKPPQRKRLNRESVPEATRLFAAGQIDRAELMKRITA
jgi:hypothetical protein